MKTIWKFPFEISDEVFIEMPKGARVLSVQPQHGNACMWAMVDPAQGREQRRFLIVGTGHPMSQEVASASFIATFQIMGGNLVFHIFE